MQDTATLLSTFEALAQQHNLKVEIDPEQYSIASPAAIDVEHDERGNLVGIGVYDGLRGLYFQSVGTKLLAMLLKTQLVAHNGKGDIEQLQSWGIPVSQSNLVHDTFLIGHILDSSQGSYGLKAMAKRELGIEYPEYDEIVGKHKGKTTKAPKCPQIDSDCCGRVTLDKQPVRLVALYNAFDTYVTFKLFERQMACIQL